MNIWSHIVNKIGFMVDNLGQAQLSYMLIKNINMEYEQNNHEIDYIVFYNTLQRPIIKPKFCCLSMSEVYGQEECIISCSSDLALKLSCIGGPSRRILYLWDLDWVRGQNRHHYELYTKIYRDSGLEIICRSESHAKLLENSFNISPIGIVEDFNLIQLKEVLGICTKS